MRLKEQPAMRYDALKWMSFVVAMTCAAGQSGQTEDPLPLERVIVNDDGTGFVGSESGKPISIWGVNYDHDRSGRLLEDYWAEEWVTVLDDLQEIKELGANLVRIHLQLPKFMDSATQPNRENLSRLEKLIDHAEKLRLYLDLTGLGCYHKHDVPNWYAELNETDRWDVQARFWQAVAAVCQDSPAVFCYDLMNEPILPGKESENEWLTGELGGKYFVQRISLDLAGRTRQELARQWVTKLTSAIREIDGQHLITVGVIPWAHVFPGAKPLFYSPEVGSSLDFVSVHFYPKEGEVGAALRALQAYEVGKPLVIEEIFPLSCSIEELGDFIEDSRKIADGWVSFYWGETIQENEQKDDFAGALTAAWLRFFRDHAPNSN